MSQESKIFIGIGVLTLAILAGAVFFFSKPEPKIDNSAVLGAEQTAIGPESPKSTLVEFSDFQCPYCAEAWPVVEQLIKDHPNDLKFVYRHFPLPQHLYSKQASYAAEAAGKQGKFWEMSTLIFQNQQSLNQDSFPKFAKDLGLNIDQFDKDTASGEVKDKVQADLIDAAKLGIDSTPTFYLNGSKMKLTNFENLKSEVEKSFQ